MLQQHSGVRRLELVVRSGDDSGKRVEIGNEVIIGRGTDTDLTLDDPEASRHHAAVRAVGPGAEIEDLGSTNGTYVNGQPIDDSTAIGPGDEIVIGQSTIELESDVRSAETMAQGERPSSAAATAPIRIDSGNVPRWQPEVAEREPRRRPSVQPISTDEMSVGKEPGPSILDRLPPLPWGLIATGVIVLVVVFILFKVVFGGGGPASKKDFKLAADKICHSTSLKARNSDPSSTKTPAALKRASSHLVKIRKAGLSKIHKLDQPKKSKKLRAFYRSAGNTTRDVKRLGSAAGSSKKTRSRAIQVARGRLKKAQLTEGKAAKAYGFKTCGKTVGV